MSAFRRTIIGPAEAGYYEREARADSSATPAPPEWLMTGVWVTVPPQKAERISPEARSFTNEFVPDREQAVARADEPPPVPVEEAGAPPHRDKIR